jgi:hypothetical protein
MKNALTQEYPMMTSCRAQGAQPRLSLTSIARVLAALAMLLFTLAAMPALAANNYTFGTSGSLPPGCSRGIISGNYNCGALTLAAGDTITVASSRPATVNVTAALTIGAGALINTAGAASDLNFQVVGAVSLGANSTMNANVTSAAATDIGADGIIAGNITTGAGALSIGANTTIKGNINTLAGVVSIGAGVNISGNINTGLGAVNLGANDIIGGNIKTLEGVVTIGADSAISGFIESGAGATILGANNRIGRYILTAAGKVVIGAGSSVAEDITTLAGVVTLGANNLIGGNINTGAGAVNIGDASRICGNIDTLVGGVITLTTNVKVGGSIRTALGGAITISGGSTVGRNIKALAAGAITLTGVNVGGNVSAAVGVITLTDTHVYGSVNTLTSFLLGFGITSTNSTMNDKKLTIAPACSAAPVIAPSNAAASFDALETGTNIPWSTTARKPLYTKLIDAPFTLDIAALKTNGTLESAYVVSGGANKYVKLELFDDVGAACGDYATPTAAQTATFTSASSSGAPGRALSGAFTVADAHLSLLLRIRECEDSTCKTFTSMAPACSSDRFSVRPSALALSTTTSMALAPAPAATAPDIIRAGADFTLLAKTSPTGNYDGTLKLDASKLTAQLPSQDASAQSGGVIGVLTPSTLKANAKEVMANYSEVGYLYIGIGAYRDDDLTAVDSIVGDCITLAAGDAALNDTLIDGKYGCSIGNKFPMRMGRFVPDHFSTVIVAPGDAMPCPAALLASGRTCPAAGFVYSGQPFKITVTALSANGTPTVNYSGLLARDVTLQAWSAPGSNVAATPAGSVLSYPPAPVSAATFVNGMATAKPAYTFPTSYPATALAAPTDIYLRARENSGVAADDVTSARAVAAASLEAGVTVVSGRIYIANNYGSELLAVPVMTRTQYWDGRRFVNSTTDEKTSISALDVTRSNCKKSLKTGNDCIALALNTPASPVMVDGALRLTLTAPGAGNTGSVDLSINSSTSPWLPSTKARIGVGIYKAGPVIYMREQY